MIKEKLYPYLLKNSDNIEDAKVFMQAIAIAIRQAFTNKMKEFKVDDLQLTAMLDPKSPDYQKYLGMFDMIGQDTLTDALTLVEGMPQEIDMMVRDENKKRPLSELKTNFL